MVQKVHTKRQLLAVRSWQPRWHLRSGRGNGRGEPGEEVGKMQRCPNITNCLPSSRQVLRIFCVLCQNHTQEEMGMFAGFFYYTYDTGMPMYAVI